MINKYFEQGDMNDIMRKGAQTSEKDLGVKTKHSPDLIRRKLSGKAVTLSVRRHRPDEPRDKYSDIQPADRAGTLDIGGWPEEVLDVIAAHSGAIRDIAKLPDDVQMQYVKRYDYYNMIPGGDAIEVYRPDEAPWTDKEMLGLLNAAHLVFTLAPKPETTSESDPDDEEQDEDDEDKLTALFGPIEVALKHAIGATGGNVVIEGEVVD